MGTLVWAPKPHVANAAELADFAEIECLRRKDRNVSVQDLARILNRQDNSNSFDDASLQGINEAFRDLGTRASHCGGVDGRYPYTLNENETLVQFNPDGRAERHWVLYIFLLLSTRLNMKTSRVYGGLDATVLFERFCVGVGMNFWGAPHARVGGYIFGTGRITAELEDTANFDEGVFKSAVDEMCVHLKEGYGFDRHPDAKITAKDGKLDVVVWRSFADSRAGRLIGFGQCKTGTHWALDLAKMQPHDFVDKWMRRAPAVYPVRLYFIADRALSNWYDKSKDGGILFDRCRLIEYALPANDHLWKEIEKWTRAAAKAQGLQLDA